METRRLEIGTVGQKRRGASIRGTFLPFTLPWVQRGGLFRCRGGGSVQTDSQTGVVLFGGRHYLVGGTSIWGSQFMPPKCHPHAEIRVDGWVSVKIRVNIRNSESR